MASLPAPRAATLSPARGAALVAGGCGLTAALIILAVTHSLAIAGGFFATALMIAAGLIIFRRLFPPAREEAPEPDWSVARTLAASSPEAVAITDRAGRLVCANGRYESLFTGFPTPPALPIDDAGVADLSTAGRTAWRDGSASVDRLLARGTPIRAEIERAGADDDLLVWRFRGAEGLDLAVSVENVIAGPSGDKLAAAGIMAALIGPDSRLRLGRTRSL